MSSDNKNDQNGVLSEEEFTRVFLKEKHTQFVLDLEKKTDTFEFHVSEHLKMSGVYWGVMAMDLIGALDRMDVPAILEWVLKCQDKTTGGFGGNIGHDPHILYTLSAVQVLAVFGELSKIDADQVANYVKNLQRSDGSFAGDQWGEIDTRFSYIALNCMDILGKRDAIDVQGAVRYVASCRNFDGGFGAVPNAESHSGQIFCCVAALAIGDALQTECDGELLGWWLSERQLDMGGLNGRPEKKEDVCYSWWVLSSLAMLNKIDWIDRAKLGKFILSCQDPDQGGLSDRPDNMADVFHTYFGIAGLSLLGYPSLSQIDPVYALPVRVVEHLGLKKRYKA